MLHCNAGHKALKFNVSIEKKKAKKMTIVAFNLKNGNYLNMTKLFKRKLKRTTKRLNACR